MAGPAATFPSALNVVALASHRIAADDTVSPTDIAPMYLRAPDAEINWLSREVPA
jgi:tRNA A37 threonylcarbamoyladenosine modification protein TsaB